MLAGDRAPTALLRLAVYGWTAMAQAVAADWVRRREPRREAVRDLLANALIGTLRTAADANAEGLGEQ